MNVRELAWAAGLFDGEGCITLTRVAGEARSGTQAWLTLNMTDEDSVRRFHEAVGVGAVDYLHAPSQKLRGNQPQWRWRSTSFENTQAVIAMLWYGLNKRRRARAKEVLFRAAEDRMRWPNRHLHRHNHMCKYRHDAKHFGVIP